MENFFPLFFLCEENFPTTLWKFSPLENVNPHRTLHHQVSVMIFSCLIRNDVKIAQELLFHTQTPNINHIFFHVMNHCIKNRNVNDLFKLYELIWRRFVACQMQSAVYDQITLMIDSKDESNNGSPVNHYTFKTTSSTVKFKGFLIIYDDIFDELRFDKIMFHFYRSIQWIFVLNH